MITDADKRAAERINKEQDSRCCQISDSMMSQIIAEEMKAEREAARALRDALKAKIDDGCNDSPDVWGQMDDAIELAERAGI